MRAPAKAFIVTLVSLVTLAFGIAPATALPEATLAQFETVAAAQVPAPAKQNFSASNNSLETKSLDVLLKQSEYGNAPHSFDVQAAIAQARSEICTKAARLGGALLVSASCLSFAGLKVPAALTGLVVVTPSATTPARLASPLS